MRIRSESRRLLGVTLIGLLAAGPLTAQEQPKQEPAAATTPAATTPPPQEAPPAGETSKQDGAPATEEITPLVEVAILLDTSNSMDGLINQARTRLWAIVNTLVRTSKGGKIPDLRVALYEYGNNGLSEESGYMREVVALTDDLDRLSEQLFALTTNGGSEHCGQVIDRAARNLSWTPGDHFRAIFIAGNEPFSQGPVDYREACKLAIGNGVMVNTIHCGREEAGRTTGWDEAARLADGRFMNIDQDQAEVSIAAPQDERLRQLNTLLNGTYVAFGRDGQAAEKRQREQDRNAEAAAPEALVQRAISKGSKAYKNDAWDLVDASRADDFDLAKLPDEQLPEAMRGMSLEEKQAYLAKKTEERRLIQEELTELSEARRGFVAAERAKLADENGDTFQTAVEAMLKEQLAKRGFATKD